jgi:hypothetical protein
VVVVNQDMGFGSLEDFNWVSLMRQAERLLNEEEGDEGSLGLDLSSHVD